MFDLCGNAAYECYLNQMVLSESRDSPKKKRTCLVKGNVLAQLNTVTVPANNNQQHPLSAGWFMADCTCLPASQEWTHPN